MTTYIVCYDLRKSRDYQPLYDKLKSYTKWAKITESNWAIVTAKTAPEVRDELKAVMDKDDRLFVVKSGVAAAWSNSICKNQWLKDNL